jgi:two-component system nitrogen regulation response regulator GlnG
LRERKEDIPDLVTFFIKKANTELNKNIRGIESKAMERLITYNWPGNVRELENAIKRATILTWGDTIGLHRIELTGTSVQDSRQLSSREIIERAVHQWFAERKTNTFIAEGTLFNTITSTVEKVLIEDALKTCENNQLLASKILGMNRSTLRKKIVAYGLK